MDIAVKPGEHICTSAQIYPDNKPVEVPPRPTWTGADPRVSQSTGAYTRMSLTERPERGGNITRTSPI